jgi:CRP-like cAMP-binding protein
MSDQIPTQELETFKNFMWTYARGTSIIVESEQDDKGLFLLRQGKVNVYRGMGAQRQLITTIQAVNFFGEMAIITGGPRTATVEAASDQVVCYAFRKPDLQAVLSNPKWGIMLVTRLSGNLKENVDELVDLRNKNQELQAQMDYLTSQVNEVFSLLAEVQRATVNEAVVTSREWRYLTALESMLKNFLEKRLPQIQPKTGPVDTAQWRRLYDEGILPEILANLAEK